MIPNLLNELVDNAGDAGAIVHFPRSEMWQWNRDRDRGFIRNERQIL